MQCKRKKKRIQIYAHMTQMITSTTNHPNSRLKEDAKSATMNPQEALDFMHDHHRNIYHSSLYRHQLQSRQQHNRSATTNNLIASSHSCGSPSTSPQSIAAAADSARPHSTPSCYSHSNQYYYHDVDHDDHTDSRCIDPSIDFNSLCDAMHDSSYTTSRRRLPAVDDDGHDSFDTMLSYLRKNDELAQQMDEIEQLETLSFLRVMYLGITSAEEKHMFLKKLSDGLSESLFRQTSAPPPAPSTTSTTTTKSASTSSSSNAVDGNTTNVPFAYGFRERKHHLLPLHLFLANSTLDDDYYNDHAAMFEDNGVSIVEADFTTDYNMADPRKCNPELILHYIFTQYQQYLPPSTLNRILNPPSHWANTQFDGHVFSEGDPNGIDLCVYFYHDAQKMADVTKDMDTLWKINALGIPVLPIMSMSNQAITKSPLSSTSLAANELSSPANSNTNPFDHHTSNFTKDDDGLDTEEENDADDDDNDNDEDDSDNYENTSYVKQRPIDIRRNELAYIFSQWRIKMMDISNLDIIGQPSFQQRGNARKSSTQEDMAIEQRLGRAWATSSITPPTPYHILTLLQFMAMDRWAVSILLKTIQDRADERRYDGGLLPTTPTAAAAAAAAKHDDTQLDCDLTYSSTLTPTNSRKQQQQSLSANEPLLSTPTFQQDKNQYDGIVDQAPIPQQKEKQLITIHIWLLYALPLLVLLFYGMWIALTGIISGVVTVVTQHQLSSTWHASLIMVSHVSGKSMTLMVNVYDGQHQPRWAPEPPLIWTNLPLPLLAANGPYSPTWKETPTPSSSSSSSSNSGSGSGNVHVAPLLNKTRSLEGQYIYSIRLPSCSLLDTEINYTVHIQPSTTLPAKSGTVQGSPLQLPRYVLCDPTLHQDGTLTSSSSSSSTLSSSSSSYAVDAGDLVDPQEARNLLEAWHHFRQYSRFYFMNSLKIVELIFTEGKEKN
ncbi:hypothetical protein BCR42DRAFT_495444 [Absidia repens]|uniref:Uncharacterized protein n=1 Tax=Absidia repens TaxID=90262 RepID=A0A1X2I351_9FUNG|nr:hypothetical protein BCR42DRAFT_495444 [Absidia repens]